MAQAVQTSRPPTPNTLGSVPHDRTARDVEKTRPSLHEGWIAGVLLAVMLISVTASVAAANWVDGLWLGMWAALGGLLFGALVARLRLPGLVAFLLSVIEGPWFTAFLASYLVQPTTLNWNAKLSIIEERLFAWLS